MPFTVDEFFGVFARFNNAIWPAQVLAYLAAVVAVALLRATSRWQAKVITGILAAMWAINGIGYHWMFFTEVNAAAWIFGAVFLAQAVALAVSTYLFPGLRFGTGRDTASILGLLLVTFAAIAYPIWGWLAGHIYPAYPAFGVAPCPTTIFTIGMLFLGTWSVTRWLLIVPILWAGVGGSAAVLLNVPQDYGLIVALLIALAVVARRWFNPSCARNVR
ncbi:MAG: hypothetical protein HC869_07825 [Rhodospirillales bacterium]|nr:hypothetical protein [Rhodospirillales bacterium]